MQIKSLEIEGYRSYGEKVEIDFSQPGVILLSGENQDRGVSSAAGKSSIFKALCCVLFEQNDDDSVKDKAINVVRKKHGCRIAVTFSVNENYYYVVYSRKHVTDGTDWRVWRWNVDTNNWEDMREQRIGDTKIVIQNIIGMTYEQFINIAYLEQKRVADFIYRTDKERREIFSNILQLKQCDHYLEYAKQWRKKQQSEHLEIKSSISILSRQIADEEAKMLDFDIASLTASLERITENILHLNTEINKCKKFAESLDNLVSLNEEYKIIKSNAEHFRALALKAEKNFNRDDLIHTESLVKKLTVDIQKYREDMARIHGLLTFSKNRLENVKAVKDRCNECEQNVSSGQSISLQEKYTRQVEDFSNQYWDFQSKLLKCEDQIKKAQITYGYIEEWQRYAEEVIKWEKQLINIDKHFQELGAVAGDGVVSKAKEVRDRIDSYVAEKEHCLKKESEFTLKIGLYHDICDRLKKLKIVLAEKNDRLEKVDQLINAIEQCENLIGDKGFKAYKIEESRVQFNTYLAEYLSVLTDGEIEAELVTQKMKVDGKGYKDDIDVLIRDGLKEQVSINQYSGGEQTTLSLAITGAFAKLAYEQYGQGINVLLLDEPFGMLDSWGEEKACLLFDSLKNTGRTILVITNYDHVRNSNVFDKEIRAVKKNHVSHIEQFDLSGNH